MLDVRPQNPRHDHPVRQPRARGELDVTLGMRAGCTQLRDLRHAGSIKAVFPRQTRTDADVVVVNTAGGITGGDRFAINLTLEAGSRVNCTTQAAERAYRSTDGWGHLTTRLRVACGAQINWVPQETILFEGSALCRRLRVDLEEGAQALICEPLVFGRAAMNETLDQVRFDDRIEIWRAGCPLYLDAARFDHARPLHDVATLAGAGAAAQVLLVHPEVAGKIDQVRMLLPQTAGCSAVQDDLLVLRILAEDSFVLRKDLIPILELLSGQSLPVSWRL